MRMMAVVRGGVVAMVTFGGVMSWAEGTASPPATTQASTLPKNIDKALDEEIAFDVAGKRLEETIQTLRDTSQTNIAVNWAALALAGITKDTPVTLHLKKLPYEQVLRCLMEVLPAEKTRPNYLVGGNTVEITTTAELGKHPVPKVYDIGHASSMTLDGAKPTADQINKTSEIIQKTAHRLLVNIHEDVDAPGRNLVARDQFLVATQSKRAQGYVSWAISLFDGPTKLHQPAQGTLTSVRERKAAERLAALKVSLQTLAAKPDMDAGGGDLNVILLPGAAAEIAKADAAKLDYLVTDGGIVEIGSTEEIATHVTLAIYDLRDVIKRLAFKAKKPSATVPSPTELADTIATTLKEKVHPYHGDAPWGDLDKSPSSMTLCEGYLVVFAPVAAHRAIAARLEELAR